MAKLIKLNNISFTYGQGDISEGLHNINIHIKRGECLLLCGESGCGKTSITRLINGLIPHYYEGKLNGKVLINGEDIAKKQLYELASQVGSVFQNPKSQFFNADTMSELSFTCENLGMPVDIIKSRVQQTILDFSIQKLVQKKLFALSGGEKQKIACASISTIQPDIIILDEPSSNLDFLSIKELQKIILMWKNQGKTIVIAEHRLYYLRELADRIIYLQHGKIKNEFSQLEFINMADHERSALGLRPICLKGLQNIPIHSIPEAKKTIDVCNFQFAHKGKKATLNILDFSLPQNHIIAIIGNNGAGKSTFAQCFCGLYKNKGFINFENQTLSWKKRLQLCFMVMQDVNHQLFTESVLDEILLSMKQEDILKAKEVLAQFDLQEYTTKHPMSLSGGQKQRVAIASAVISQRDIIVFDEPTSGLDLKHMKEVAENLKNLALQEKTLLIITHDLEFILSCCTHIIQIDKGTITKNYPLTKNNIHQLFDYFKM